MKKLILLPVIFALILSACKKDTDEPPVDTPVDNFAFTVSNSQEAYVLITTATWCTYCAQWGNPTFNDGMNGTNGIDAARVNGIALHYSTSDPMYQSMASAMKTEFAIGGPPNLWIEFNNQYNVQPSGWKNAIVTRQNQTNPVCGVAMNKVKEGGTYTVYTKVEFFTPQTGTYNIAVYAVENGIVATQATDTGSNTSYTHNHVLRGEITANTAWGTQLFNGSSQGEYKLTYTYTPAAGVNIDNVHFVAVIYRMSNSKPVESPNSNTI